MGNQRMSQTRLRAWLATVIWALAGAGFFLAFFSGGGVDEFDTDSGRHLVGAAFIAFGFVAHWTSLWITRRREGQVTMDERDFQVVARAGQATLIIVLVAIFGFNIGLWTIYEGAGVVAVGWMWFLAYGCLFLAYVIHALAVLILDGRTSGHG
ncbi:MAG: DUF2178 domain-containing protein [Gemmatimonadota bacterium]